MPSTRPILTLATLLATGLAAAPALAQQYTLNVASNATFTGTSALTLNFSGSLRGNYDATTNPTGTRTATLTNIFFPGPFPAAPANATITINNSSASGTGSPNTSPRGTLVLRFNSFSRTVELLGVNINAIGPSAAPTLGINVTFSSQNFRTQAPAYSYPISILGSTPIPLGSATITQLQVTQAGSAVAIGTPRAGGGVDFSITVPAVVSGIVNFQGTLTPIDIPQILTVTGFLVPSANGSTATASASFSLNATQALPAVPGDPANPLPFPFPAPPPNPADAPPANLLAVLNVTGGTATLTGSSTLPSSGPSTTIADVASANQVRLADAQRTADDIIVFLGAYFAADALADVAGANQSLTPDGQFTADDIIVFLGAYFAP
jgi:hypothetical protein